MLALWIAIVLSLPSGPVLGWGVGPLPTRGGDAPGVSSGDLTPPEGVAPDFPRIADLGLITVDPGPHSRAYLRQCERVAAAIRSYTRLDNPMLPEVHITQGPWAWGDGSASDPLVLSEDPELGGAQMVGLIAGIQTLHPGGCEIWLDARIEVRIPDAASLDIITPYTHLRGWDPLGTGRRPTLHKWDDLVVVWQPAVEPVTGRVYFTTPWSGPAAIRLASGTPTDDPDSARYGDEAFLDCGDAETFAHIIFRDSTNAFYMHDGVLHVYARGGRFPGFMDLQVCDATNNIVTIEADGAVIDGLHLNGGDQAYESYVVKCVAGDAAYVVRDCFMADAFKHIVGTAGAGTDGTVCLSERNVMAGGRADAAGFTHEVNYADWGDCDYLSLHNTYISGAHGPNWTRGTLLFSHSSVVRGSPPVGSVINAGFRVRTTGFTGVSRYVGVSSMREGEHYAQICGDVVMDIDGWGTVKADGSVTSPGNFDAAFGTPCLPLSSNDVPLSGVNVDITYRTYPDVNKGAFFYLTGVDADVHDCSVKLRLPVPSADPPGDDRARAARVRGVVDLRFHGCDFYAFYAGGDENFTFFWDDSSGTADIEYHDCTWEFEGATRQMWRGL